MELAGLVGSKIIWRVGKENDEVGKRVRLREKEYYTSTASESSRNLASVPKLSFWRFVGKKHEIEWECKRVGCPGW